MSSPSLAVPPLIVNSSSVESGVLFRGCTFFISVKFESTRSAFFAGTHQSAQVIKIRFKILVSFIFGFSLGR